MGTYEKEYDADADNWDILDPDGDIIASVSSEDEADALLFHLNRDN